ncbi:MAG: M36 family metallopeptidase [Candidatus Marinimicrobia bacterium]|nr:M36 family metallopeptidase [Candidatus Neomarinimicrobiota bacterium]
MAYYHSDEFENWLVGKGMASDQVNKFTIYTHNSSFYASTNAYSKIMYLSDGVSGLRNPSHEAAIICHEYMHGVSETYNTLDHTAGSGEEDAMDEAYSDYFGVAYSNQFVSSSIIGDYIDESGGYVYLRNLANTWTMSYYNSIDLEPNGTIEEHDRSVIFSGALWNFRTNGNVNASEADELILESLNNLDNSPTFLDGRDALISADIENNDGCYVNIIKHAFYLKGIGTDAIISGTLQSNETWYCTQTLEGIVYVPTGITLTITEGTTVDLNNYAIVSTGGTITIESDVTISPDIRLKTGSTLNGLYPTISSALSASSSGKTVEVNGSNTLASSSTVPSGVTLVIKSGATLTLGSYNITTTSGTITVESGAIINSSNSHLRLVTGSTINGLYPTIASAVAAGSSGQTFEIYGPHTLTANYSIPSVVSLSVKSGATLTFGSYSIVSSGGTITVASDATLSPDARRKSGSTILGLYPSITSALTAASSGQTVEYGGSHTMSSNLTVSSGITLSAKAGSTLSFGSGYYLSVSGTLNASGTSVSRATFTRSGASGTWGGIRYQSGSSGTLSYGTISYGTYGVYLNSSSPDVDHCNISSCSYGIYCTSASPDITNNTISNSSYGIYCTSASPDICNNTVSSSSTYGIYVYNGSPDLETNQVTGSQVYMNACDSYMYDNYFVNASSCNQALYLYGSSPSLFNNTINPSEVMLAINITNDSDPWFGDYPGLGHNYIYNENNEADGVIWATNYSNPIIGYGSAGPYIGGNNSIIGVTGIYPATAYNNSSIDAAWCWWGQYPAPACYGDVDTHDALSSDPGGGSSLAKSTYLAGSIIAGESVSSPADSLYKIGLSLFVEKQYESAIPVFKKLIVDYPDTKYASKAISMVMRIGRTYDKLDRVAWIDELLDQIDHDNLTAALKGRKVLLYRQSGRIDEAMELSAEIAKENPGTMFESAALFDLFNMYQKDLGDSVSAGEVLAELKTKYPDDDQTIIARSDFGENVAGALMKRHTLPKPEQQPVALTPTEYSLSQAFPNPFNPVTKFGYTIPEKSPVRLEVFDLKGRLIETLVNQTKEPGNYQVAWDASKYPSGIYLYKIQAGTYTETRKCLLIK